MKHKHSEVLHAFVDGVECEFEGQINEWHSIASLEQFDTWDNVRIKPEPPKEPQYLYVFYDVNLRKTCMSPSLMQETYQWVYMGKVRVEK